jgi:putative hydrolase of the HAD superfamily
MEKNYSKYIEKFLSKTGVMVPMLTHMEPYYKEDPMIRVVVLDVYGTILISASGDIDESEISTKNLRSALLAADIVIPENLPNEQEILTDMLDSFRNSILHIHNEEKSPLKPYPEVNILEIWEEIIHDQKSRNHLVLNGELCIKCFTFVFEVLSNNIYPMPGMKDVITRLTQREIPLGIISNAQFYTPVILNYFMHNKISEEEVFPFDPDLTIFSYRYKRSKPDALLFDTLKQQCNKKYHISADQVLFVGNDMFRDIYPAHKAGFKTALFAGDKRSLRLREEKPEVNELNADYILTDLKQLLKIVT